MTPFVENSFSHKYMKAHMPGECDSYGFPDFAFDAGWRKYFRSWSSKNECQKSMNNDVPKAFIIWRSQRTDKFSIITKEWQKTKISSKQVIDRLPAVEDEVHTKRDEIGRRRAFIFIFKLK